MSLDYRLPDHLTNADLDADGYADDMYGFLVLMMVTKCNKPDETFIARVAQYACVAEYQRDNLPRIIKMANYLRGMSTNVMQESDAKWKAHLHTIIKDRAAQLLREVQSERANN